MHTNLLFFGFYFAFVAALHISHAFLVGQTLLASSLASFCILLQTALETVALITLGYAILQKSSRLFGIYLLVPLLLFLVHLVDFPLERLMNMSFWHTIHLVSQESGANFVQLLTAANIPWGTWMIGFCSLGFIVLSGFFVYKLTNRYQAYLRPVPLALGCLLGLVLLLPIDYQMNHTLSQTDLARLETTLPWKNTFFREPQVSLTLPSSLGRLEAQSERIRSLDSRTFSLVHKPDIYIIIAESLRSDFINQVTTPNLHHFKQRNISFPITFSNANGTHLSWFSLFHSEYPFRWQNPEEQRPFQGSLPLSLLKKMGYQIHISSSAKLPLYHMDEILFGENHTLADSLFSPGEEHIEPYVRDEMALSHLMNKMQENGSARVFILFLDATHFGYSFPEKWGKFTPYSQGVSYLRTLFSKKVPASLVNRYQNALLFIDSQFGKLMQAISRTEGGKDAVIAFTGDHGEEFYEHGNLFHASMLTKEQISPPIFYRFGSARQIKQAISCRSTCHMDIFPSIFHYLTGENVMKSVLEGQSIFEKERWPFTVIARFNGSRPPKEYCIHGEKSKLLFSFEEPNVLESKKVLMLSTKTYEDDTLSHHFSALDEEFASALEHLFSSPR